MSRVRQHTPGPDDEVATLDLSKVQLLVLCRGRRILAVDRGEPEHVPWPTREGAGPGVFELIPMGRVDWDPGTDGLAFRVGFLDAPPTRPCSPCSAHQRGHLIDGERLREVVERLCRPGRVTRVEAKQVIQVEKSRRSG